MKFKTIKIPKNPNKNLKFLRFVDDFCEKNKKIIKIVDQKYVLTSIGRAAGYCDGNEVKVCYNDEKYAPTLCHEFCHLVQSVEEPALWKIGIGVWGKKINSFDDIFKLIAMEWDCERKSVSLGNKFNLFDEKEYSREANAYLMSYQYYFLTGKWKMPAHEMLKYMDEEIVSLSSLRKIDMDLIRLFDYKF